MSHVVRMAQVGTGHAHAAGKLAALLSDPGVEVAGVYEPDAERRRRLSRQGGPYREVHWFADVEEMLGDATILAVASEGRNVESLDQTEAIVRAGKHVWYDKPAGEDWPKWQRVMATAQEMGLHIQMGYMFRYHEGFCRIASWAKSGLLGDLFGVRAHMSTCLSDASRRALSVHKGGAFYDLAGHMLDQIVWLLGRPAVVTSFLRNDSGRVPEFADNTLAVLEYERAMAIVDIAAMEPRPVARRYEVYGSLGSAILVEPFEPARRIRLCLASARDGYAQGEQFVPIASQSRQSLYELELQAFLATVRGWRPPDRSPEHELLVQETLLRGTGVLAGH
jgi:predicted dehydrogenase